ncbi:MAG TPA: hypothetical protein VNL15_01055 [Dehalococcoidia bacterium]|nr:hypothetical protein [Dehalococcoidia bacterium]
MAESVAEKPTFNSIVLADLNGRRFFAWRMALACETALREVNSAIKRQPSQEQKLALAEVNRLLKKEMHSWVQRGEALDIILERLPQGC